MESLLGNIPGVVVYFDDILITGKMNEEYLAMLEEVLKRLKEARLRLKKNKCVFLADSAEYLGHRIDLHGLHPLPEKVETVKNAPKPNNVTKLKSYLGHIMKFLPNLSTALAPMYQLLKADVSWHWGREQSQAFQKSKDLLLSSQVWLFFLVHFYMVIDSYYRQTISHYCPYSVRKTSGCESHPNISTYMYLVTY